MRTSVWPWHFDWLATYRGLSSCGYPRSAREEPQPNLQSKEIQEVREARAAMKLLETLQWPNEQDPSTRTRAKCHGPRYKRWEATCQTCDPNVSIESCSKKNYKTWCCHKTWCWPDPYPVIPGFPPLISATGVLHFGIVVFWLDDKHANYAPDCHNMILKQIYETV